MERGTADRTVLDSFVIDFVRVVERHCKYIIVSGFVVISHGRSRATEDVDMIIERLPQEKFAVLHEDLLKAGFECMQPGSPSDIYTGYLADKTSIRYTRKGEFIPEMEVKLAKDALDEYQISSRQNLEMTGLDVFFSSVEMNIAFKEELLRSDKDMEDAKHMRSVYKGKLNDAEIERAKEMIRRLRL